MPCGCSSVGYTDTAARQLTLVRSRESRREIEQHRVAPWRRKTGRRAPQRLQLVFFAPEKLTDSGSPSTPYGGEGELVAVHAGEGAASLDAPRRGRGTAAGAALGAPRMEGSEGMWLETLEADFERLLGPPLDGRLLHPERLLTALRRLDRWADFGQGRCGAGVEVAQRMIENHAERLADEWDAYSRQLRRAEPWEPAPRVPRPRPRHLGYFVPALLQLGRRWRRTHRSRRRRESELRPGLGSRDRGPRA